MGKLAFVKLIEGNGTGLVFDTQILNFLANSRESSRTKDADLLEALRSEMRLEEVVPEFEDQYARQVGELIR